MLKGLAITPPVLGRISIGKVVEKNGKRLPEKDDQFKQLEETRKAAGSDQTALDNAARQGFNNGAFEDSEEDTGVIVEEFFPATETMHSHAELQPTTPTKTSLAQKLEYQASRHARPSAQ